MVIFSLEIGIDGQRLLSCCKPKNPFKLVDTTPAKTAGKLPQVDIRYQCG